MLLQMRSEKENRENEKGRNEKKEYTKIFA